MVANAQERAVRIFRKRGGVLRAGRARDLGIHPATLYSLRDEGVLERVSRGVYRLADLPATSEPDLIAVATRVERGVICLVSALAFHEITSEVPHEVYVALPRGHRTPQLDHPPIRVFRFSGSALTEDVGEHEVDGVTVRVYGAAKSVVDCFRLRGTVGTDVAVEALKMCLAQRRADAATIFELARKCRIASVMRPYLEALL